MTAARESLPADGVDCRTVVEIPDDLNKEDRHILDLIIEDAFERETREFSSFEDVVRHTSNLGLK